MSDSANDGRERNGTPEIVDLTRLPEDEITSWRPPTIPTVRPDIAMTRQAATTAWARATEPDEPVTGAVAEGHSHRVPPYDAAADRTTAIPLGSADGSEPRTDGPGSSEDSHPPATSGAPTPASAESDAEPSPDAPRSHVGGLPAVDRRAGELVAAPQQLPMAMPTPQVATPILLDPRTLPPLATPRSMQWSLAQIIQVLTAMAVIAGLGAVVGWMRGGDVEPTYAARSEFIYFLEDAMPDGFLREDRRILTQLVTLESEAVVGPVADRFETSTEDIRDAMDVEVVDLSEVVRLDVEDPDPERALAINEALLEQYQQTAEISDRREDLSRLVERRDELLLELEMADSEVAAVAEAELADVELELQEESLDRELDNLVSRLDRLSAISDDLLTETTTVDDTASINSQLAVSRQRLTELEAELLVIRTERAELQRAIQAQLASEVPFTAAANQERDVTLSVREDSIELEIDTVAERIRRLEGLAAQSLLDNQITPDGQPVEDEILSASQLVGELEDQLLEVRTRRAELAQSAATRPSLLRRIDRLEQDLEQIDDQLATANISGEIPSPIEVLTSPVVLDEPVGNPRLQWAAIGFLASLPIAAIVAAFVRQRQRRRM